MGLDRLIERCVTAFDPERTAAPSQQVVPLKGGLVDPRVLYDPAVGD